jgi:DNA-binding PucR family transcriptional regulator
MVPEMNAILENDRNNGTNYFETLKCYLENDRNMLQAAKKLNVHRTTLAYRLEKISIIMNTNVDDKNLDPLLRLFFHFCEILHQK